MPQSFFMQLAAHCQNLAPLMSPLTELVGQSAEACTEDAIEYRISVIKNKYSFERRINTEQSLASLDAPVLSEDYHERLG